MMVIGTAVIFLFGLLWHGLASHFDGNFFSGVVY